MREESTTGRGRASLRATHQGEWGYAGRLTEFFLVTRANGPAWDGSRGRREQRGWDEHAAFMDALADEGFVVLGGPVGGADGDRVLLVVDAAGEDEIHARLREDPWDGELLTTAAVEPWLVWLRGPGR